MKLPQIPLRPLERAFNFRQNIPMLDEEEKSLTGKTKLRNLDFMSVSDLEAYVADLQAEIMRVQAEIAKKSSTRAAAEALFGKK